jgi:hypothetical protein
MEQEIKAVLDDLVNTAEKIDKLKSDDIEKFLNNAVDITPIKSLFRNRYKGFKIILSHKDGNPGVEFIYKKGKAVEFIYKKGKAEVRAGWKPYEFSTREYEFGTKVDTEVAKKILDYLNKIKFKKVKTTS